MRLEQANATVDTGWYAGPWNSNLPVSVGYANSGVDDPHVHTVMTEIYVVGRGTSTIRVGRETVTLRPGDMIVVEPGEPHTFLSSSADYFHLVIHTPGLTADEVRAERLSVPRSELGLD